MENFCDKYNIRCSNVSGVTWYKLIDIGRVLELKKPRNSINEAIEKMLIKDNKRESIFISESGLKRLIVKSRKPAAIEIANILGIPVIDVHCVSLESATISFIMTAFAGESMIQQYTVGIFRIDLYFDEYKIAVECKEINGHSTYTHKNDDIRREEMITSKLGCTFICYTPSNKENIANTINSIFKIILSKRTRVTN